ncbi:MAG: FAD/NAD(P)-binding oxidoreductase [Ilumatobacteraceae bacterium]
MSRVVVLGAGVSGHTAALHLRRLLGRGHEVVVVSPNSRWNWIPSNIWVGVGKMTSEQVTFPLAPIYERRGIHFHQAKAVALLPEGDRDDPRGAVEIVSTAPHNGGTTQLLRYDYLVNATGPKLRFEATPGLGPDGNSVSVCSATHATQAAAALDAAIERMRAGQRQTLVVGMGHGTCTCEGAAFEYVFNVDHTLREAGVRELAEVIYLTNEHELGDFGVGGMVLEHGGEARTSEEWMAGLFAERDIRVILGAHVTEVRPSEVAYETIAGESGVQPFDFAMLLPPFGGAGLRAFDRLGTDITERLFAPSGFMRVDAEYTSKPFEAWEAADWPSTYQSPEYANLFAVGIAFAPPHAISRPYATPDGTPVAPSPPRTGMPSGVQGRTVARTIADRITSGNPQAPAHTASMAKMGAACIASIGTGLRSGAAAAITMSPIVPDRSRFPETGRDQAETFGEVGLAGHWMKRLLHTLFIYKAKARPGWWLIPE